MQHEIMRAEIERHANDPIGELLRRVNRRIRPYHDRCITDNGATAELPAAPAGLLNAAVITPFASIVQVGLALLQQAAVAGERVHAFWSRHIVLDLFLDTGVTVDPLDLQALLGE